MKIIIIRGLITLTQVILLVIQIVTGVNWLCIPVLLLMVVNLLLAERK